MEQPFLNRLQRWMQSVITHPAGVSAGLAAPTTQTHLEVSSGEVEKVIQPSLQQSSVERLAVYAQAYYARLMECLQAEFPMFCRTVGDDAFAEFAVAYLQRHPSHSYTLGQLGAKFVQFLQESRPETAIANAEQEQNGQSLSEHACQPRDEWIDFLIDLARLERTVSEVFDGPGLEAKSPISHEEVLAINPQRWPNARLTVAPCVRLVALRFPLNDYYTAMKASGDAAIPPAQNSWLAITRRDYIVRRYELSKPQFALLEALQRGETVGDAIAVAAQVYPGEIAEFASDLQAWFRMWTAAPMFEQVAASN